MTEQLHLINDIPLPKPKISIKGKYQKWKYENNYRKSFNEIRCENCKYLVVTSNVYRTYYKCIIMGTSSSQATDVRLSYVCDKFTPKQANCQLCKHLDCDTNGHFICGLDSDVLDHEGIYCPKFEEYIEESEGE